MRLPSLSRPSSVPAPTQACPPDAPGALSRRTLFAGAGAVGALGAAAALLPAAPTSPVTAAARVAADASEADGYRETPHVAHYYRTARV